MHSDSEYDNSNANDDDNISLYFIICIFYVTLFLED